MKAHQAVLAAAMAVVLLASTVLFTVEPAEVPAMSCGLVDLSLAPCLEFLRGRSSSPPPGCCSGVRSLKDMTPTTLARREACECLKQAASRFTDMKPDQATRLPALCGVDVGVPISMDVDCNKIS